MERIKVNVSGECSIEDFGNLYKRFVDVGGNKDSIIYVTLPSFIKEVADAVKVKYPNIDIQAKEWVSYPQLVEILNEKPYLVDLLAEWNPLVNSIVETGTTNWIKSSSGAYVITECYLNSKSHIKTSLKIITPKTTWYSYGFFVERNGNDSYFTWGFLGNGTNLVWCLNSAKISVANMKAGDVYHIDNTVTNCNLNGVDYKNITPYNNPATYSIVLPGAAIAGNRYGTSTSYIKDFYYEDDEIKRFFVPFVRDGELGMLNIEPGDDFNHFYTNQNGQGEFILEPTED